MRTADFDYPLPQELIAQHPIEQRDASRLLTLDRSNGAVTHRQFTDLDELLRAGDVLVANNSRVIPARVRGQKEGDGARVEILFTEEHAPGEWWCMLRPQGMPCRPAGSSAKVGYGWYCKSIVVKFDWFQRSRSNPF